MSGRQESTSSWMMNRQNFRVCISPTVKQGSVSHINIGDCAMSPCSVARNLGVASDQELSMETHAKNICHSAMAHSYEICDIRTSSTQYATEKLVHASVAFRIDNGNALLCRIPSALLNNMQRVQNTTARMVSGCQKLVPITPVLKRLQWLPFRQRIR